MNITKLEMAVLVSIDNSEYGCYLIDDVWTFSVSDNIDRSIVKKLSSLPGIISSLCKKGVLISSGEGEDSCVGMTEKGVEIYISLIGEENVNKIICEGV